MQPEFWHDRWRSGQIGFHQPAVDRHLPLFWPRLELPPHAPVLVPLCGKSLDLQWLRERGHPVVGVEISALAIEQFLAERGIPARRRPLPDGAIYEAPNLTLIQGDFFALTPAQLAPLTPAQLAPPPRGAAPVGFWDRASAVAFPAPDRPRYVAQLARLLPPGARGLLVALEYPQAQMQGPPFSLEPDEVQRLFGPHFDIEELVREDRLEHEPRMRSRGVTRWHEVCYGLTRR